MKKILLTVAATSLCAFNASADTAFKSGFKAGAGVGYKHHSVKHQISATSNGSALAPSEKQSKSDSKNTMNFQGHLGYDWVVNKFLMGLETQYRFAPGAVKTRKSLGDTDGVFGASSGPDHKMTQTHRHDFALAANLGALVTKNVALYAIASVRLGHFKHTSENFKSGLNTNGTVGFAKPKTSKSKWLLGAGFGAGAKWMVSQDVSVGVEATYDMYKTLKTKDQFDGVVDVHTSSKKPRIFNAMLTTSWHF